MNTRAEQARRTRQNILARSLELFLARGYDGTSLREIAEAAGLTKAAVYYYFPTKGAIVVALTDPIDEAMGRLPEIAGGGRSRAERLERLANAVVDLVVEQHDLAMLFTQDPALGPHTQVPELQVKQQTRKASGAGSDVAAALVRSVYGPSASPTQAAGIYALPGIVAVLPLLKGLSKARERRILLDLVRRILDIRPSASR